MSKPNPFISGDLILRTSDHGLITPGKIYKVIEVDGAFVIVNSDDSAVPVRAHHSGFEAHIKAVAKSHGLGKSEVQKVLEDAAIHGTGVSFTRADGVKTHIPFHDYFKSPVKARVPHDFDALSDEFKPGAIRFIDKPTIKAGAYVDGIPEGTWKSLAELGVKADAPSDAVSSTLDERGKRYGDFTTHAVIAQRLQKVMQTHKIEVGDEYGHPMMATPWDTLKPYQRQALTVIADKIARILNGDPNYADNWHDIQGYAKLVEDRLK